MSNTINPHMWRSTQSSFAILQKREVRPTVAVGLFAWALTALFAAQHGRVWTAVSRTIPTVPLRRVIDETDVSSRTLRKSSRPASRTTETCWSCGLTTVEYLGMLLLSSSLGQPLVKSQPRQMPVHRGMSRIGALRAPMPTSSVESLPYISVFPHRVGGSRQRPITKPAPIHGNCGEECRQCLARGWSKRRSIGSRCTFCSYRRRCCCHQRSSKDIHLHFQRCNRRDRPCESSFHQAVFSVLTSQSSKAIQLLPQLHRPQAATPSSGVLSEGPRRHQHG
jgi:hypothetical protein